MNRTPALTKEQFWPLWAVANHYGHYWATSLSENNPSFPSGVADEELPLDWGQSGPVVYECPNCECPPVHLRPRQYQSSAYILSPSGVVVVYVKADGSVTIWVDQKLCFTCYPDKAAQVEFHHPIRGWQAAELRGLLFVLKPYVGELTHVYNKYTNGIIR